jgi:DNA (cytosine-5)-methyltransferase 1
MGLLNGLDLFSGIGGISYALGDYVRPIAYCEIDRYCQGVLLSRMANSSIVVAPIWDDIRSLSILQGLPNCIDIIYGGFPCQDISIAGLGKGLAGERSGLFYEIVRLCREIKPRFVFLENVPAITTRGGTEVVREITALGYDCRWCIISAASVGKNHIRERFFLLAHPHSESKHRFPSGEKERQPIIKLRAEYEECEPFPKNESTLLGMDDELSFRMDRTRALGNSVVPQQVKEAFEILIGLK